MGVEPIEQSKGIIGLIENVVNIVFGVVRAAHKNYLKSW